MKNECIREENTDLSKQSVPVVVREVNADPVSRLCGGSIIIKEYTTNYTVGCRLLDTMLYAWLAYLLT